MSNKKTEPVFKNGRFANPWNEWPHSFIGGSFKFMGWMVNMVFKHQSPVDYKRELPVYSPFFVSKDTVGENNLSATWLGHASVLFEIDGVKILCDPVFSNRVPSYVGPKRYRPIPCKVEDLPKIDVALISHNHYDHMDHQSITELNKIYSNIQWCVPMGSGHILRNMIGNVKIKEFSWWDELRFVKNEKQINIVFTPTQHWSNRGALDRFKSLWGSWTIIGQKNRVFFGGDTGYCAGFKEIGKNYGPFDLAAIPIGAYDPRNLMKYNHVNPEEAVQIHCDIKSKFSFGIHWGTFVLTEEPKLAPKQELKRIVTQINENAQNDEKVHFITIAHGETLLQKEDGSFEHLCGKEIL